MSMHFFHTGFKDVENALNLGDLDRAKKCIQKLRGEIEETEHEETRTFQALVDYTYKYLEELALLNEMLDMDREQAINHMRAAKDHAMQIVKLSKLVTEFCKDEELEVSGE